MTNIMNLSWYKPKWTYYVKDGRHHFHDIALKLLNERHDLVALVRRYYVPGGDTTDIDALSLRLSDKISTLIWIPKLDGSLIGRLRLWV